SVRWESRALRGPAGERCRATYEPVAFRHTLPRMNAPPADGSIEQDTHQPITALGDLVVLDLSHALAGPFASTMLGDYGAEIIKIEPLDGEIARGWGPPFYGDETAYFINLNRNKKSVAIDLKHPDGRALFFRLL